MKKENISVLILRKKISPQTKAGGNSESGYASGPFSWEGYQGCQGPGGKVQLLL